MDYKKLNSHILLHLLVAGVILILAIFVRLIAIQASIDTGTANLIFIAPIVIFAIAYLIILSTLANTFIPWLIRKLPFRQQKQEETSEPSIKQPSILVNEEVATHSYEAIRQEYDIIYLNELSDKVKTFKEYTSLIFAPHITKKELLQLHKYIVFYAQKEQLSNVIPIKARNLRNLDLFHYGWNMAHHFEQTKQDVVPWLQDVFENLQGLEFSYIKGKLYDSQTRQYIIPNIEDIPEYLAVQDLKQN